MTATVQVASRGRGQIVVTLVRTDATPSLTSVEADIDTRRVRDRGPLPRPQVPVFIPERAKPARSHRSIIHPPAGLANKARG